MTPPDPVVRGLYLDGRTSTAHDAVATVRGDLLVLTLETAELDVPLSALDFEPPLGRLRRVVRLPDDARFETEDHEAIRALEVRLGRRGGLRLVHRLESRWRWALACLGVFVVVAVLFVLVGLPVVAGVAASLTPRPALAAMDRQALRVLEREYLSPSTLAESTRLRLRGVLRDVNRVVGGPPSTRLLVYRGEDIGANALALPGGTIVVTDQLVGLARDDRELAGILAHEVGHVRERHGVAAVYRSVGLLLFASVVVGDVTSASSVATALPVLLVQSGYSRDMEREADEIAGRYLLTSDGTTLPLRRMLRRLAERDGPAAAGGATDLMASHPGIEERLRTLTRMDDRSRR